MNVLRILDANINRASEGIRVLEDIARFAYEDAAAVEKLRNIRHMVRKGMHSSLLIGSRESLTDIGLKISSSNRLDSKDDLQAVVNANFKRVQEALRSIEENLKIVGSYELSKTYEGLRYKIYDLEKNFIKPLNLPQTDIYAITGEELGIGKSTVQIVSDMIKAGIKIIQYREKNKTKQQKYIECMEIRRMTKENGVCFIVNDDIDIAIAVKADGVHVGQEDLPVEEVRKLAGNIIIGLSTHNQVQALDAISKRVDYIGVGPIFYTTTKQNLEKSEGLDYLKWISTYWKANGLNIPFVAIGGIKEDNIRLVKESGGRCFAMISELNSAVCIEQKLNAVREKLRY